MAWQELFENHLFDAAPYALLALKLAVLSLHIGVLIYALPLPIPQVKKWAPRLIEEAIIVGVLALSFHVILLSVRILGASIGATWEALNAWILEQVTLVAALYSFSMVIDMVLESVEGIPVLSALISKYPIIKIALQKLSVFIVNTAAPVILGGLYLIGAIYLLLYLHGGKIFGLGLALYAVPFGAARSVGAWLLALYIVFMIGLPFLPIFLNVFAGIPITQAPEGYSIATARMEGLTGPVQWGVLQLLDSNGSVLTEYNVYAGRAYSEALASGLIVVPREAVKARLDYMGLLIEPSNPRIPDTPVYGLTLYFPLVVWNPHPGVLVYSTREPSAVESGRDSAVVEVEGPSTVVVVAAAGCGISSRAEGGGVESEALSYDWRGVPVAGVAYTVHEGSKATLTVEFGGCSWEEVKRDLARENVDLGDAYNIIEKYFSPEFYASLLLYYLVLPSAYIAMLLGITAGVARVLGGGWSLPIKPRRWR